MHLKLHGMRLQAAAAHTVVREHGEQSAVHLISLHGQGETSRAHGLAVVVRGDRAVAGVRLDSAVWRATTGPTTRLAPLESPMQQLLAKPLPVGSEGCLCSRPRQHDKPAYLHTALRVYARSMCPLPLAKRKASPITALSGQMVPFGSSRVRCFEPGADNPPGSLLSWSPQKVVMRERISAKVVLCETETENSSPVEASTTVIFAICSSDF